MTPEQKKAVEHLAQLSQMMIDYLRVLADAKPGDARNSIRLAEKWAELRVQVKVLDNRVMNAIPTLSDERGRALWEQLNQSLL